MFKNCIRILMVIFCLALVAMAINSSNYSYFVFFSSAGLILSISLLAYGLYAYKEKRYAALFKADVKLGGESIKPSVSIVVASMALLAFLYSFYSKEILHFRMQALLHEAKELQKSQ